jgi:hypothetical protein
MCWKDQVGKRERFMDGSDRMAEVGTVRVADMAS